MRPRAIIGALAATAALAVTTGPAAASTTCTWGGTPAAPTGTFSISPGLTNFPTPSPLKFSATGVLGGGDQCKGKVTFSGQADAGSTCPLASFEGAVLGVRGVSSFWAKGNLVAPSQLYDKAGNHVGEENAELLTQTVFDHATDCTTPQGFTGGWPAMFSSVIVVF